MNEKIPPGFEPGTMKRGELKLFASGTATEITFLQGRVLAQITSFTDAKRNDVTRGLESPYLAVFAIQKYLSGIFETCATMELPNSVANPAVEHADKVCDEICPNWKELNKHRRSLRPADIR